MKFAFLKEAAFSAAFVVVAGLLLALFFCVIAGCDGVSIGEQRPSVEQPYGPEPGENGCPDGSCPNGNCPVDRPCTDAASPYRLVPPVDLPVSLREPNYAGGSCMYAAFCDVLRWQGLFDVADEVRANYRGGQVVSGLAQICDRRGLRFAYTADGDESFLDWCSRTRRGAVIHWRVSRYSDHAITFCGYAADGNAVLIDNNATKRDKRMPKAAFVAEWHRNGGKALTVVYDPYPPRPWAASGVRDQGTGARGQNAGFRVQSSGIRGDVTLCGRRVAVRVAPNRVDVRWRHGRVYVPTPAPRPYGGPIVPAPRPYLYPPYSAPDTFGTGPPLPIWYR